MTHFSLTQPSERSLTQVLESLMYDSLLSLGGFLVVLLMMVRHTRSYVLAVSAMVQISSTVPLAYFVYTRLQQVEEVC